MSLLLGCADAARYVVVSDEAKPDDPGGVDRRLICLSGVDARANAGLLQLGTTWSVRKYGEERRSDRGAAESGGFFFFLLAWSLSHSIEAGPVDVAVEGEVVARRGVQEVLRKTVQGRSRSGVLTGGKDAKIEDYTTR